MIFPRPSTLLKPPTQALPCEFCKIWQTIFLIEHLWWLFFSRLAYVIVSTFFQEQISQQTHDVVSTSIRRLYDVADVV